MCDNKNAGPAQVFSLSLQLTTSQQRMILIIDYTPCYGVDCQHSLPQREKNTRRRTGIFCVLRQHSSPVAKKIHAGGKTGTASIGDRPSRGADGEGRGDEGEERGSCSVSSGTLIDIDIDSTVHTMTKGISHYRERPTSKYIFIDGVSTSIGISTIAFIRLHRLYRRPPIFLYMLWRGRRCLLCLPRTRKHSVIWYAVTVVYDCRCCTIAMLTTLPRKR